MFYNLKSTKCNEILPHHSVTPVNFVVGFFEDFLIRNIYLFVFVGIHFALTDHRLTYQVVSVQLLACRSPADIKNLSTSFARAPRSFLRCCKHAHLMSAIIVSLNNYKLSFPRAYSTGHYFSPGPPTTSGRSGGGQSFTSRKLGAREAKKTILLGVPVHSGGHHHLRLRLRGEERGRLFGGQLRKMWRLLRTELCGRASQALIHLHYRHSRIGQFLGFGPRDKRSASSSSS